MKNYKPFFVILALLMAIGAAFLIEHQLEASDVRSELTLKVKELERRNQILYDEIEGLNDQIDDCQHDLQDCLRTREGQAITDATKY